jgi:hypothetical protein
MQIEQQDEYMRQYVRTGLSFIATLMSVAAFSPALAQFNDTPSSEPRAARTKAAPSPKKSSATEAEKSTEPKAKTAAPAATIPHGIPMSVAIVRSNKPGCEPTCAEWIAAQGMIEQDTLPKFRKVLKALGTRKLPILIDSPGGSVDDSLTIGRLIRAKGLDVAIARTRLSPCTPTDKACLTGKTKPATGAPTSFRAFCASSCAFILAGGTKRYASLRTPVGLHNVQSYKTTGQLLQKYRVDKKLILGIPVETKRTLIAETIVNQRTTATSTPEGTYTKIAAFFTEMGVTPQIMPIIKATPHTSIHWLTRTELTETRLVNANIDGEELISGVINPATPPMPASSSAHDMFKPLPHMPKIGAPVTQPPAR